MKFRATSMCRPRYPNLGESWKASTVVVVTEEMCLRDFYRCLWQLPAWWQSRSCKLKRYRGVWDLACKRRAGKGHDKNAIQRKLFLAIFMTSPSSRIQNKRNVDQARLQRLRVISSIDKQQVTNKYDVGQLLDTSSAGDCRKTWLKRHRLQQTRKATRIF